jgi:hypothetical protein
LIPFSPLGGFDWITVNEVLTNGVDVLELFEGFNRIDLVSEGRSRQMG